ncbi:MAG: beta-propeller domain-containing protein, partial [Ruminococcus sp.]|nr:beta-propeller domain-containing protein [Ruminococcus sp.]
DKKYKKKMNDTKTITGGSRFTIMEDVDVADDAMPENGIEFDSTNSDTNYYIPETQDLKNESETSEEPSEFIPITEPLTQTEITTEPAKTEAPSEVTVEPTESTSEQTTKISTETTTTESEESNDDYSKTHNQEENVLEADIVKTDGERIYYLTNKEITGGYNDDGIYENYLNSRLYITPTLNIASVDNGIFTDSVQLNVTPELKLDESWESEIFVNDMYLYNDMIAVIGTANSYCKIEDKDEEYYDKEYDAYYTPYHYENDNRCFVSFYTKDAEFIGTYWQDGCYSDVRIAPDGYMYLVSTYNSVSFDDIETAENIKRYIPECGVDDSTECMPPEDILLPEDTLDNNQNLSYTIIGSIDLTVSAQFTPADSKALAGYTGTLYSSADNIYTTVGWENTDITRISVSGGNIIPAASGTVEGYVKDQFSMSEYNGCFRIATTVNKWTNNSNFFTDMFDIPTESEHIADNRVYVLDMELNQVGYVGGFGKNETIKSVNFSGNMGYVVTYEQTDPLFAIDLTNPAKPFITDEFKILGYSTYMQNWTDGLLLGFGADADENGIETGIKLVMFDNSDPYNLQEVGLYAINRGENQSVSSGGMWDRKQLLIAPEKNLIGIPVYISEWTENYDNWNYTSKYMFFSYENGEFISKGEIAENADNISFDRAIYIGGYVYAVSANKFVSADMETITVTDEINFD